MSIVVVTDAFEDAPPDAATAAAQPSASATDRTALPMILDSPRQRLRDNKRRELWSRGVSQRLARVPCSIVSTSVSVLQFNTARGRALGPIRPVRSRLRLGRARVAGVLRLVLRARTRGDNGETCATCATCASVVSQRGLVRATDAQSPSTAAIRGGRVSPIGEELAELRLAEFAFTGLGAPTLIGAPENPVLNGVPRSEVAAGRQEPTEVVRSYR
jgi:hypothetical protein